MSGARRARHGRSQSVCRHLGPNAVRSPQVGREAPRNQPTAGALEGVLRASRRRAGRRLQGVSQVPRALTRSRRRCCSTSVRSSAPTSSSSASASAASCSSRTSSPTSTPHEGRHPRRAARRCREALPPRRRQRGRHPVLGHLRLPRQERGARRWRVRSSACCAPAAPSWGSSAPPRRPTTCRSRSTRSSTMATCAIGTHPGVGGVEARRSRTATSSGCSKGSPCPDSFLLKSNIREMLLRR